MCESFGEGPKRLTPGGARTTHTRARGPTDAHHVHSDPGRAHSEFRDSTLVELKSCRRLSSALLTTTTL
eukprot:1449110-Pyramimonas_sp.AAC.1